MPSSGDANQPSSGDANQAPAGPGKAKGSGDDDSFKATVDHVDSQGTVHYRRARDHFERKGPGDDDTFVLQKPAAPGGSMKDAANQIGRSAAKEGIKQAAVKQGVAKAVAGGTGGPTSSISSVVSDAQEASQALQRGDAVEAGSAAVRGGATIAANVLGSPLIGTIVSTVLKTKFGRSLTKSITWIILAALFIQLFFFGMAITAASSAVVTLLSGSERRTVCVDPVGGGVPVSSPAKLKIAATVVEGALDRDLGVEGAIIGVMTALAESDLRNNVVDVLQPASTPTPLKSIGVFQQMPFYWANEFWPAGTKEGSTAFYDTRYYNRARSAILDVEYASRKFYEKFDTHPKLKDDQWKALPAWDVAQTIQVSIFSDGSNYAARWSAAKSTVATILQRNPELAAEFSQAPTYDAYGTTPEVNPNDPEAQLAADLSYLNPCGVNGTYAGWAGYVISDSTDGSFVDGPTVYPNTEKAVQRALSYVGNPPCDDGRCYRLCDNLAGRAWGYGWSGYESAREHWYTALRTGVANPGNRTPPIGALLYWDSGRSGHVATYVGDGMVVSNMNNGTRGANVYLVPASYFEEFWGAPYLGWSDPIFRGGEPGSALNHDRGPRSFQ